MPLAAHPSTEGSTSSMESTAMNDIWNPTSWMHLGLAAIITIAASASAFSDIRLRFSSVTKANTVSISALRSRLGDIPATNTNAHTVTVAATWASSRRRPPAISSTIIA